MNEESDNEKKIFTIIEEYSLFEPTGKENDDLRSDFPELDEDKAFTGMQSRELRFVWMVANRASPIIKMEKGKRIETAASVIWGKGWQSVRIARDLGTGVWKPYIVTAINRMKQFNPTVRLRARLMTEYAFDQLQTIMIATPKEIKLMDFDSRKKYTELLLNVNQRLPEVVNNLERGYGIVIKKVKDEIYIGPTASSLSNELANE